MGEARTITVLFTDFVASTELAARLGDNAADEVRRACFGALRGAIGGHRGVEVKNLGDGLMVAFDSAADAVACAAAMQQAVVRLNRTDPTLELGLRVGLSLGEATPEDGDWFGTPVVVAARLCEAADAGQVLTTELVRAVVGSRSDRAFANLGEVELKGLPEPVAVCEVAWEQPEPEAAALPAQLAVAAGGLFVGREAQLERLIGLWKEAAAGSLRGVLVTGEPGIGKTRLTAELARQMREQGALVLYGRCDEDMGVAYQPLTDALRRFVDVCPREVLAEYVREHGGNVVRIVPELAERVADLPAPLRVEPEAERYRLFGAVVSLLAWASRRTPVLVVLDDLHWAAKPALLLLRYVLSAADDAPVLVVGTYRDTELSRTHPLAETLAELRRLENVERMVLSGLDEEGVAAFVEAAAGQPLDRAGVALARAVHEETEGNPFFIGQILRHLAESGAIYQRDGRWTYDGPLDELGIPEGVKEVIGRRLSRLSDESNRLLQVAAVIGREFDLDVLAMVSDTNEAGLLKEIDAAVATRVVEEVPAVLDRYSFTHALVRETLCDELTASRRVRLHGRVGEVIEALRAPDLEPHLGELAYHFGEAAEILGAGKAAEYARRAGDAAMREVAYEEAARHYESALYALRTAGDAPSERHVELLLGLGDALRGAGQSHRSSETFEAAAALARELDHPELLARAAVGYENTTWLINWVTQTGADAMAGLLQEAHAALGSCDTALHALVLAHLPRATAFVSTPEEKLAWARQAKEIAEQLGDKDAQLGSLNAFSVAYATPGHVREQLAVARELVTAAEATGSLSMTQAGHTTSVWALTQLGDMAAIDLELNALEELAHQLRDPYSRWCPTVYRAMRATVDGRFDEAERLAFEAFEIGQEMESQWALTHLGAQLFTLRRYQDRIGELEAPVREQVNQFPLLPAWRCALAGLLATEHREVETRAEFEILAANDFADLPRDFNWLVGMSELSDVCTYLGDAQRAAILYASLSPYANQGIAVAPGDVCAGSVARCLGELCTTMHRFDDAEAHFERALTFDRRIGPTILARTQLDFARMLLARAGSGDRQRAVEYLDEVLAIAHDLGMRRLLREGEPLRP